MPPLSNRSRSHTVAQVYRECLKAVNETGSSQSKAQFKSLGEKIGIESGQLDRMLQHSSALRRKLVGLLSTLQSSLELGKNETASPSGRAVRSVTSQVDVDPLIVSTISSIVALVSATKWPAPSDNLERLTGTVVADDYTRFDIEIVQQKFPLCDKKLQRRLGILNRLRRLKLQDAQDEHLRQIQRALQEDFNSRQNTSGPLLLDEPDKPFQQILAEYEQGHADDAPSIASYTTGYRSIQFDPSPEFNLSTKGDSQPRSLVPSTEPRKMPGIPKSIRDQTDVDCPLCRLPLEPGIQEAAWHKHLAEDIEPYICTFGGCSQSYRTFGSLQDWQDHEDTRHRLAEVWTCQSCDKSWTRIEEFNEHMSSQHSETFMPAQLERIARLCRRAIRNEQPRAKCILCGAQFSHGVAEEYEHLAVHLVDIALVIVPALESEELDSHFEDLMLNDDDTSSDTWEPPPPIEGIPWFQKFNKDALLPFDVTKVERSDGFTSTWRGVCKLGPQTGNIYAIQTWPLNRRSRNSESKMMQNEVEVLRRMTHVHIISIVGCYMDSKGFSTVLSPPSDLYLNELLRNPTIATSGQTSRGLKTKWFGCLAAGLAYLHSQRVRHRDIKPHNILLKDQKVIISGFQNSWDYGSEQDSDSDEEPDAYTMRYASPEVVNYDLRNSRSDVFSLGCVFLEMLTVFAGRSLEQLDTFLEEGGAVRSYGQSSKTMLWLDTIREDFAPPFLDVIEVCSRMLKMDPNERLAAQQVLYRLVEGTRKSGVRLVGKCTDTSLTLEAAFFETD